MNQSRLLPMGHTAPEPSGSTDQKCSVTSTSCSPAAASPNPPSSKISSFNTAITNPHQMVLQQKKGVEKGGL